MARLRLSFLLVAVMAGTGGCVALGTHYVPTIRVLTPGLRVVAEDGTFTLTEGAPAARPFDSSCHEGSRWNIPLANLGSDELVARHADALQRGARRVRVFIGAGEPPLYGVLLLCRIPNDAKGIGSTVYSVQTLAERVEQAKRGQPVVLNESYNDWYGPYWWNTWVLWLSRDPLQ